MSATRAPRILAGFVQGSLASIDQYDPEVGAEVRAKVRPDQLAAVTDSWPIEWIPVESAVALTDTFVDRVGLEAAAQFSRKNLVTAIRKPPMNRILEIALRRAKDPVASMLRQAPRGWGLIYRDAGFMEVDVEERVARIGLTDLPDVIRRSDAWIPAMVASCASVLDLAGVKGTSRLAFDSAREVQIEVDWSGAPDEAAARIR